MVSGIFVSTHTSSTVAERTALMGENHSSADETDPLVIKTPRIPEALQAVFLASNRGVEVLKPPPNNLASKVFQRLRRERRKSIRQRRESNGGNGVTNNTHHNNNRRVAFERGLGPRSDSKLSLTSKMPFLPHRNNNGPIGPPGSDRAPNPMTQNPQIFLEILLRSRGYCIQQFPALRTAYRNAPTPLQKASYHAKLVHIVQENQLHKLESLFRCGISPNPCNGHGESLVHLAARLSNAQALNVMIENGASLQVCDAMGRTPLHEACSRIKPCFTTIHRIIRQDMYLFLLADARGHLPLAYVPKQHWGSWLDFIYSNRDVFWPRRHVRLEGIQEPPLLTQLSPNSRPVHDPPNALPTKVAELVVSGRMTPQEVQAIMDGECTSITESIAMSASVYQASTSRRTSQDGSQLCLMDDDDEEDDDDDSAISMLEEDLAVTLNSTKCYHFADRMACPELIEI
ncbi:hypothetical protein ACA910_004410 [Epithemia clementina (nom. ined.)]